MNIYHHSARGNQPETWTLVIPKSETKGAMQSVRFSNLWQYALNFASSDVMYYTLHVEVAEAFATNHGLQIEEGTE